MGVKFRFKSGDFISGWLVADGLRDAARAKTLLPDSQVQQAGRDDWVSAGSIPGLIPAAVVERPVDTETKEVEHARAEQRQAQRPPESIHHLLHRALHMAIQVTAHDDHQNDQINSGTLIGLTVEGLMVEFAEFSAVVYIPLNRVRSAMISNKFPALGPPRRGEVVRIDVDSLPELSTLVASATASGVRAAV
ncbi:MAG: hypothetical protein EXS15_04940 [Phycisphaerales bacterium]|nr:hypothetical protein [Phycisphaerales bacterium]